MGEQLLFGFTFLFGVIRIITWMKIFDIQISGFFNTFYTKKLNLFFNFLDHVIFISSLIYQIIYWLY